MSFLLHLVVSWWGVSDVGVAFAVTNVAAGMPTQAPSVGPRFPGPCPCE